jgi:hypothetical protein
MPARRRSLLDRFLIILGSITGLVLVPAAGIALLPEADGSRQDRSSSGPDSGGSVGGREGASAAIVDSEPAQGGAPAGMRFASEMSGQTTMILAPSDIPSQADIARAMSASAGGGVPSSGGQQGSRGRDTAFVQSPGQMPDIVPSRPGLPPFDWTPPDWLARLIEIWPRLAEVKALGTDNDTWGVGTAFLIVSRAQDNMIETSDGALHMLINRGFNLGLTLISSRDGGKTWFVADRDGFGTSNRFATSDIRLIDGQDVMIVSYIDNAGRLTFAFYDYDILAGRWTRLQDSIVDPGIVSPGTVHSTIALTAEGTILLAYTDETDTGLRLVLQQSFDNGQTWTKSVLWQPDVTAGTARVMSIGDDNGIIYSTAEAMYWLTWDAGKGWNMKMIDAAGSVGRFHSHFSTVTFDDTAVIVNIGTDLTLRVLLFDGESGIWSKPVMPLQSGTEVSSAQISISRDTGYIYITYDDMEAPGRLIVIESRDGGVTWRLEAVLQTPEDIVAPPTRFEAPEQFSGDLVVTQQILDPANTSANGLYFHTIDVDGPGKPLPPSLVFAYADDFVF